MKNQHYVVTVREISQFSGIKMSVLNTRIHALKIKTKRIPGKGTQVFLMKKDIPLLLRANKEKYTYHPRKLEIINMHRAGYSNNTIADTMHICKKSVAKCIKEFFDTGCVVVESKINFMIL